MQFIDPRQAKALVEAGAQLVDVRDPHEYAAGALPGAINLPLATIPVKAREVLDPGRPVVLYCLSGARSAQAQMLLQRLGFDEVHNLGPAQNYYAA